MTEQLQEQLTLAASRLKAKAIDSDIFKALVTEEIDPTDSEAVERAAKKVVQEHPALFKVEKAWNEMEPGSDEWRKREEKFRASLRKPHSVGPNEFAKLDAALLDPEQFQALTRMLQGRGSSYDRSILRHALAEQRNLLGGDAA